MGLASLAWPFSWDAGIFTWVAQSIRHGAIPYLDAWDAKGPFASYAYAAVQGGGPRMWPVRLLDLAVMSAGALATGRIVTTLAARSQGAAAGWHRGSGNGSAGAWTAMFILLTYYATDFWNTAQPDAWIAAIAAVAMLILLRGDIAARPVLLGLAALLLGLGVLQKPTFAAWLLLPALAVLLGGNGTPASAPRRLGMAAVATALTLVPAALTAWWFHRHGAWPALVEGYLTVNLELSRSATGGVLRALPWSLHRLLTTSPLVLAVPGAVLGVAWLWQDNRRAGILLTLWALASWVMAAAQRRYFPYHWDPLLLSLAPLAGIGYAAALGQRAREGPAAGRILATAAVGALLVMLVLPLQVRVRDALARATGRMDAATYLAQFPAGEAGPVAADLALAEYLGSHTSPADLVVVWDSPLPNALSGRKAPSRIGFFFPLVMPAPGGGTLPPGPVQQRLRAEYLAGLAAPGTRLVAVSDAALRGIEPQPRKSVPMLFPELADRLASDWTIVDSVGTYRILARRAP